MAVVPARGGSKGIPRKNLRQVCGISLIGHAARTIAAIDWLDCAVLSTDDDEMAAEGERYGLAAPFRRPPDLSDDKADSAGMWQHAWREAEAWSGLRFDASILLQPTTPQRRTEDIAQTMQTLWKSGADSALTVSPLPSHFAPEKILRADQHNRAQPFLGKQTTLRQEIPAYYYRNGACYAATRECLLDAGDIVGPNCAAVIIDRQLVNIDEEFELDLAEYFMKSKAG